MSNFLPHEPTPEERQKAADLVNALCKVEELGRGHELLTGGELAVVEAMRFRVRARVRQTGFADAAAYEEVTKRLLSSARSIGEEPLS